MSDGIWNGFFEKLAENAEFRTEFVELALRHGVDFSSGELSDEDLGGVAGGSEPLPDSFAAIADDAQNSNPDLQNMLGKQQETIRMLSNTSKVLHDTTLAIIRKIG